MNSKLPFLAKPLLTFPSETTDLEMQDFVRRVVPASELTFRLGRMFLNRKATLHLAQAVLDGRIEGDVDQARVIIDQITQGAVERAHYVSADTARDICKSIIEGHEKGDVQYARELLARLNHKKPKP